MARSRIIGGILPALVVALSLGTTSCGGSSDSGSGALVLVSFNVPNIGGVALNTPLIFTFTENIVPSSYTPDTLRVFGPTAVGIETDVTDGNLLALLPELPTTESYSNAGLAADTTYSVSLAVWPAPSTITSTAGDPLVGAPGYNFQTTTSVLFIETRRPITHGLAPSQGGRSDDEGCLQNPEFDDLYTGQVQFGSGIGARLLCLKNEGPPRVVLSQCAPFPAQTDVGSISGTPGKVQIPEITVVFNEPLDPLPAVAHQSNGFGVNLQLWLVGDTDRIPLPVDQIPTIKPVLFQNTQTTVLSMAVDQPLNQGTYMINISSAIRDLSGIPVFTGDSPDPAVGGFVDCDNAVDASGEVPNGLRIYFVTKELPDTPQAFTESFTTNQREWGDVVDGPLEPGVYRNSNTSGNPTTLIAGILPTLPYPSFTLQNAVDVCAESTTMDWNGGLRFLGLPSLTVNPDMADAAGTLRATKRPHFGSGEDGVFLSGGDRVLATGPGGSADSDGIWEFESFTLESGDTLTVNGTRPLLILCRNGFTVEPGAVIQLSGAPGGPGLDTDGSPIYDNISGLPPGGLGGIGAAGGGSGGRGSDPINAANGGNGVPGAGRDTVFLSGLGETGGLGGTFGDIAGPVLVTGGGGGGHLGTGLSGSAFTGLSAGNAGAQLGTPAAERSINLFLPDRCYSPNADITGGSGGAGGGLGTTDGTVENGDEGGGGGGAGGGGVYVIADTITVDGSILANGGDGGSSYAVGQHILDGTNSFVVGVSGVPAGRGGPGGGGSGGLIALIGNDIAVNGTATLAALGGAGGTGDGSLAGGNGSGGKVLLSLIAGGGGSLAATGSVSPIPATPTYNPTIDLTSVGRSEWYDMIVNNAMFSEPFYDDNFDDLAVMGLALGADFTAVLEFQGADDLTPEPLINGGGLPPLTAVGLTGWVTDITLLDGKRWFQWRWRFSVDASYPAWSTDPGFAPLPAISDMTIPFER